jgi:hypothetical protein
MEPCEYCGQHGGHRNLRGAWECSQCGAIRAEDPYWPEHTRDRYYAEGGVEASPYFLQADMSPYFIGGAVPRFEERASLEWGMGDYRPQPPLQRTRIEQFVDIMRDWLGA